MGHDVNVNLNGKETVSQAAKNASESMGGLGTAIKGVTDLAEGFIAFEVINKIKDMVIDCSNAFGTFQRNMIQLKSALGDNEESFKKNNDLIEEMSKKTLASKEDLEHLVAELATLGKSDAEIDKITKASVALSNVTGKSLNESFTLLNGTYTGNSGRLDRLLPQIKDLTKAQLEAGGAVDLVNQKFGATSDAMSTGYAQTISDLKKSIEELKIALGQGWAEALAPALKDVADFFNKLTDMFKKGRINVQFDDALGSIFNSKSGNKDKIQAIRDSLPQEEYNQLLNKNLSITNGGFLANPEMVKFAKSLGELADKITTVTGGARTGTGTGTTADNSIKHWYQGDWDIGDGSGNGKRTSGGAFSIGDGSGDGRGTQNFTPNFPIEVNGIMEIGQTLKLSMSDEEDANELLRQQLHQITSIGQTANNIWSVSQSQINAGENQVASGAMSSMSSSGSGGAFVATAISNITQFGVVVGLIVTALQPLIDGFFKTVAPALNAVIAPLIGSLTYSGQVIGQMINPVLQALAPILMTLTILQKDMVMPVLQMLTPVISILVGVLQVLNPVIKAFGAVVLTVMSPIQYVADFFTWFGKEISYAFGSILNALASINIMGWHPLGGLGSNATDPGSFTSDAFTGLAQRIADLYNDKDAGLTNAANSAASSSSSGANASYQQAQPITINMSIEGNLFADTSGLSFDQLSLMVNNSLKRQKVLGLA